MSSFEVFKKATSPQSSKPMRFDTVNKNRQNIQSATLKGFLLNNNIKKGSELQEDSFDFILQSAPDQDDVDISQEIPKKNEFNTKKAIKPVAIVAGLTIAAAAAISMLIAGYSKHVAIKKPVRPPDVPRCINILEEPHLAMYRALRDPNSKNILGLVGVALFSFFTLAAKSLVDGVKDVWIKKQNCDIDYDLQENLIEVEKNAFSGKISILNKILNNNANYFRNSLNEKNTTGQNEKTQKHINFKGESINKENKEKEEKKKDKTWLIAAGGVAAFCSVAFLIYRNLEKTSKNIDTFIDKVIDTDIRDRIARAQTGDKKAAIDELIKIFRSINIKEKDAKEILGKISDITEEEISSAMGKLDYEKTHIFAQAPENLGGVAEKIQYYCYVNEERGHLYNWILNPENKWNKYLFLSFSVVSSIGYLAKSAADAVKQVTVSRENSKSELNLRRRLVNVEINNYKAKKLSAINPMIDNFNYKKKEGKSKEELTSLAQNILLEIKNGPPYIYS